MTAGLDPLQRLVLRELSASEGTTTTVLARRVCQPHWEVRAVVEQLWRRSLIERSSGGWRLARGTAAPSGLRDDIAMELFRQGPALAERQYGVAADALLAGPLARLLAGQMINHPDDSAADWGYQLADLVDALDTQETPT